MQDSIQQIINNLRAASERLNNARNLSAENRTLLNQVRNGENNMTLNTEIQPEFEVESMTISFQDDQTHGEFTAWAKAEHGMPLVKITGSIERKPHGTFEAMTDSQYGMGFGLSRSEYSAVSESIHNSFFA